MDQLVHIIGLAPSELSLSDLKVRLEEQRSRMRLAFEYFRAPQKTMRAQSPKKESLTKTLRAQGLSMAEILRGLEKLKKKEEV